ncbi:site-specific integrase [Endozoicomonas ascidiicola]|uniref:site-specific integrase n=1 Tax=Endozoicomonas ascidiicola TaxID=1698521 RepID=UPI00082A8337|nr:site-specific integrase [Endozoicomonas ascidiicola]
MKKQPRIVEGNYKKTGKKSYTVTVRRMIKGEKISKTKTFHNKRDAKNWYYAEEERFLNAKTIDDLKEDISDWPVRKLVHEYLKKEKKVGRSKKMALRAMVGLPTDTQEKKGQLETNEEAYFAHVSIEDIDENMIISYARYRISEGNIKPQTVAGEISNLRSVCESAEELFGLEISDEIFRKALKKSKKKKLVAKSTARTRKASMSELDQIMSRFEKTMKRRQIPMAVLTEFAYESCMRQSEIINLKWSDLNEELSTITIPERKDPNSPNRDEEVPLMPRALQIIKEQKKTSERIFPYKEKSVSSAFTRVCKPLNIIDLRFHDLRRTGLTRLIDLGFNEFEVRLVSGHKDIKMLQRYIGKRADELARKMKESPEVSQQISLKERISKTEFNSIKEQR